MIAVAMRWLALVLTMGTLVVQGCQSDHKSAGQSLTATPPVKSLDLWFCKLKPVVWRDNDADGALGVGDAIVYSASLASKPSCEAADQTTVFSAVEEVVQVPSKQVGGANRYLTNFQGTLKLNEGTLQLRGLQSFVLSAEQFKGLKNGQDVMRLLDVLPDSATFTVVGGGQQFEGLVGTASYAVKPDQTPVGLRVTLYRQVNG